MTVYYASQLRQLAICNRHQVADNGISFRVLLGLSLTSFSHRIDKLVYDNMRLLKITTLTTAHA